MTYRAVDEDDNTAELTFTFTIETATAVRTLVSAVAAGDADGRLRFMNVPEPAGGPAVAVTGNPVVTAGGSFFLDVATDGAADTLLVSIGGESFGYYEIDLDNAAASAHRLTGQLPFDLDPALGEFCLQVTGVDDGGAAGQPACQTLHVAGVGGGQVQITVSWDTDADLDLHVLDPNGDEVFWYRPQVASGGELDLESNADCEPDSIRNEHIAWTGGAPPAGRYEVRVNHFSSCGAVETDYLVTVYNHGRTSTFSGTFVGRGSGVDGGFGAGRVITVFEVPGAAGRPQRTPAISSTYRGSGDQVFVLNPGGEILDDATVTLKLGDASVDVYVIATNTTVHHADPHVERLDIKDAQAKGRRAAATEEEYEPKLRTWESQPVAERAWITEFNNNPPLSSRSASRSGRLQARAQGEGGVAEGDRFTFLDRDFARNLIEIPATARKVVTDGTITTALWVADKEWYTICGTHEKCVTQQMVDAAAEQFLRPGAANDIYDWVTAVFGAPWVPIRPAARMPRS